MFGNTCFGFGSAGGGGGGSVASAENGLSLDGTAVVLGQDVGDVGNPAILTSDREIPMDGHSIQLNDQAFGDFVTFLFGGAIINEQLDVTPGVNDINQVDAQGMQTIRTDNSRSLYFSIAPSPKLIIRDNSVNEEFSYETGHVTIQADGLTGNFPSLTFVDLDGIGNAVFSLDDPGIGSVFSLDVPVQFFITGGLGAGTALLAVDGEISTGDPGDGQGLWLLGKAFAGTAFTLVANNALQVRVDNTVYLVGLVEE